MAHNLLERDTMKKHIRLILVSIGVGLVAVAALVSYQVSSKSKKPMAYTQQGTASWYGPGFNGKKTASGNLYNENRMTAAHRKLPLGSEVTVINLENGKRVEVVINDRGPYAHSRIIDLSKAAAKRLDILDDGTAKVRIEATSEQLKAAENLR